VFKTVLRLFILQYVFFKEHFRINTSKLAILLRHSVLFSQFFRTYFNKPRRDRHLERQNKNPRC